MINNKNTTKILFILSFANALFGIIFVYLFVLHKEYVSNSISNKIEIEKILLNENAKVFMQNDFEEAKRYSSELIKYSVPDNGTVDFIETLELIVFNSGLDLNINRLSIETNTVIDSLSLELMRLNIDVSGNWQDIQYFLKVLENYPLKIDIEKMSLSKTSNILTVKQISKWSGNFEFTVLKIKD